MRLLKTIRDRDIFPDDSPQNINYIYRKAVRAVLFDDDQKIALLNVSKNNYHKLPGGGANKNEDDLACLRRECLEEVGCDAEIVKELGMIKEFRDQFQQEQDSFCYLAKVRGPKKKPQYTAKEIRQGFRPIWVAGDEHEGSDPEWLVIDNAIELLEASEPTDYEGKFIQKRDLVILLEAKKHFNH